MAAIQTKCTLHTATGPSTFKSPRACCPQMPAPTVLYGTIVLLYTTHKCRPRPKNPAPPISPKALSTCPPDPENPVQPSACSLNRSGYEACQHVRHSSKAAHAPPQEQALWRSTHSGGHTLTPTLCQCTLHKLDRAVLQHQGRRGPVLPRQRHAHTRHSPPQPVRQAPHCDTSPPASCVCNSAEPSWGHLQPVRFITHLV